MKHTTRPSSFLIRNLRNNRLFRANAADRGVDGYALIVMLIAVTVLAIGLLAVLPSIYQESRREKEEELIFRGNQYARAVYLFQQQFQRYPNSVKELLHTNQMSFLRKAWPDPMTPSGKWRFIHVGSGGALLDSWTVGFGQSSSPLGQSSSNASGGSSTQTSAFGAQSGLGQSAGAFGASGAGQSSFGVGNQSSQSGQSSFSLGDQTSQSAQSSFGIGSQTSQSAGATGGRPTDTSGKPKKSPDCAGGNENGPTSAFFTNGNQPQGAGIAGVASCSDEASIRTWNKHTHYDEWEFLGVGFAPTVGVGTGPVQATPVTGQTGQTGVLGGSPSQPGASPEPPGAALPVLPPPNENGTGLPDQQPPLR